jgi:hypothetical protein
MDKIVTSDKIVIIYADITLLPIDNLELPSLRIYAIIITIATVCIKMQGCQIFKEKPK